MRELNAAARDVRVSPDAWQRHQQLLAGNHVGRRARRTWLASAAAVVIAVVAGFTALSGTDDDRPAPPAGSDPFEDGGLLGTPVEVARLGSGPTQVRVEMAIADGKGRRPDMCTRFVAGPDSTSSCGGQSDDPGNAVVAFDYLSGSRGSTISVQGVVDNRVSAVRAWLSDGTEVRPRLVALGVDELRGFAVPTKKGEPHAVRLAAYTSDGKALEYVNLAARFGTDWLSAGPVSGCPADLDCQLQNLDPGLIAQVIREPDRVIVLVWPEVSEFEVSGPSAVNHNGLSGDEPGALIRALVITSATFGGPLDAQLTLTAHAGANSVEMNSPPP
ncbi:MAG: hypothetical protein ABJA93_05205 [Sporichthyaceae bacterium]